MKTSNFKGISFHKVRGRWRSEISISSRNVHLGYFDSAADAAQAYDRAVIKRDGRQAHLNFSLSDYESELPLIESYTMEELVAHLRGKSPHHQSAKSESAAASARQKQELLQKLQHESQQKRVANELKAVPRTPAVQRDGPESPILFFPSAMQDGVKRNASFDHLNPVLAHPQAMGMAPAGSPPPLSARSSPELSMSEGASVGGSARSAFSRYNRTPNSSTANSAGTSPCASPGLRCESPHSQVTSMATPAGIPMGIAPNQVYLDYQQSLLQQNQNLYFLQQLSALAASPKCGQGVFPANSGFGPEIMQSLQYFYSQPANAGIVANQFAGR